MGLFVQKLLTDLALPCVQICARFQEQGLSASVPRACHDDEIVRDFRALYSEAHDRNERTDSSCLELLGLSTR